MWEIPSHLGRYEDKGFFLAGEYPPPHGFLMNGAFASKPPGREGIKDTLDSVVVSCVVPPVLGALEYLFRKSGSLSFVGPELKLAFSSVEAKEVETVVNALAASSLWRRFDYRLQHCHHFCAVTKTGDLGA